MGSSSLTRGQTQAPFIGVLATEWPAESSKPLSVLRKLRLREMYAVINSMCAKSLQWCPTLCDHVDCSPAGSSVHGFSRQKYRSGLPSPPPEDLPTQRWNPHLLRVPHWQACPLLLEPRRKLREMCVLCQFHCCLVCLGTRNQPPDFHCTTLTAEWEYWWGSGNPVETQYRRSFDPLLNMILYL